MGFFIPQGSVSFHSQIEASLIIPGFEHFSYQVFRALLSLTYIKHFKSQSKKQIFIKIKFKKINYASYLTYVEYSKVMGHFHLCNWTSLDTTVFQDKMFAKNVKRIAGDVA